MQERMVTIITSFFWSPYHPNRAPYNEQLFDYLKEHLQLEIIRPIAWTDKLLLKRHHKTKPATWKGIPISFPTYYFLPKIALRLNGLCYLISILSAIFTAKQKSQFIITTCAYPDAYASSIVAKTCGVPYGVIVHGTDINDLANRRSVRKAIFKTLHSASFILAPSQDLKNKIKNLGIPDAKVHVFHACVEHNLFKPMERRACEARLKLQPRQRVTYIGNIIRTKGVYEFVAAAAEILRSRSPDIDFCLIGKGKESNQIAKLIADLGYDDNIRLIGMIDHEELVYWINASDIVCLPSYSEGTPNVLLEAMACQTNIVATSVGGIPEIVASPNEYLIEPRKVEPLVNKLKEMLTTTSFVTKPAIKLESYRRNAQMVLELIEQYSSVDHVPSQSR